MSMQYEKRSFLNYRDTVAPYISINNLKFPNVHIKNVHAKYQVCAYLFTAHLKVHFNCQKVQEDYEPKQFPYTLVQ